MKRFRVIINIIFFLLLISLFFKIVGAIFYLLKFIVFLLLGLAFLWSHRKREGGIDWDIDDVKSIVAFILAIAAILIFFKCC